MTPSKLDYTLICDSSWSSVSASVSGWIGSRSLVVNIERGDGQVWSVNGQIDPTLSGLQDIDLGFTPASNANAIRRLDLAEGDAAASTAVWLDTEDWTVKPLRQTYECLGEGQYAYASPTHGYQAVLVVDDFCAVVDYPALWSMVR